MFAQKKLLWFGNALLVIILLFAFFSDLGRVPSLWWDEGWTLGVARSWAQDGFFGLYRNGQEAGPTLSGHLPVTGLAALSFRLFGVGTWQGRLPGVLGMLAALGVFYLLARRLSSPKTAGLALGLVLLAPMANELHPILIGRQVLGEITALLFLAAGFGCLYIGLAGRPWLGGAGAGAFFAAALISKAQVVPFWWVGLAGALLAALWQHWWREAGLLALVTAAAWGLRQPLVSGLFSLVERVGQGEEMPGLFQVTALVLDGPVRAEALGHLFTFGLLTLVGAAWALWKTWVAWRNGVPLVERAGLLTRLAILGLVISWLGWYALLGMAFVRYLFIPVFLGSLFSAEAVVECTRGLRFRRLLLELRQAGSARGGTLADRLKNASRLVLPWLVAGWLVLAFVITSGIVLLVFLTSHTGAAQTAAYLNQNTPPTARIETYDSELFFMLERPYHYPPASVSVTGIQNDSLGQNQPILYDPLSGDPDYLVVGPFSRKWKIYDAVLAAGEFALETTFPGYAIYRRVR